MSLSLLQGYSSAEEEEAEKERFSDEDFSEDDDEIAANRSESEKPFSRLPKSSSNSLLPSALDVFSEVIIIFALFLQKPLISSIKSHLIPFFFSCDLGDCRAAGISQQRHRRAGFSG